MAGAAWRQPRAILIAGLLAVGGCTFGTVDADDTAADATAERFFPGDRVELTVVGQDDLTAVYELDHDGRFEMPLIGSVDAYALTSDELAARVVAALADGYLRAPDVRVAHATPRPVFVFGEVSQPGSYVYSADLTVASAIERAGGTTEGLLDYAVLLTPAGRASAVRQVTPQTALAPGDILEVREVSG